MQAAKRIFFGWKIVGASVIVLAIGLGMFTSTNSVFVKPICDSLGFTRSQFTFYRTIITLVSVFVMPVFGRAIQRFGIKKLLLWGSLMLGLVTIGYSFASSLWHFYVLAFVNGIFFNAVSFIVIGILISAWFKDKKGLATGLAYSGSGFGAAIMIPVVSRIIELTDWRFAYRFMGVFGLVILIPVILLFIKDTPEKVGLLPYTSMKKDQDGKREMEDPVQNLSFGEALKTGRFWLLSAAFFFIAIFASATNTHSTPYLSDIGYSTAMVSAVMSLCMLSVTAGKIILGLIYDGLGTLTGNVIVAVCCIIFPVAALLAHLPMLPWVYAVTVGLASCGVSVPIPILIPKYFGVKDYPTIFSVFTMISTLGQSFSVPAMGAVYDYTGSYRPAWVALLIFSVVLSVCLVAAEIVYLKNKGKITAIVL